MQSSSPEQNYLANLRKILTSRFNEEELKALCFDLRVDYDTLRGAGKVSKAIELIEHLERRNRLSELIEVGRRQRQDIDWDKKYLRDSLRPSIGLKIFIGGAAILIAVLALVMLSQINATPATGFDYKDPCMNVRLVSPQGANTIQDAPGHIVSRDIEISWVSSECVMIVGVYQNGEEMGEYRGVVSGTTIRLPSSGATEIKIWRAGPNQPADSIWVWVH